MNIKSFLALSFFQKKIFLCDKEKYNYSIMKIISLLLNPINYKKSEFMKKIYFLPLCLFAAFPMSGENFESDNFNGEWGSDASNQGVQPAGWNAVSCSVSSPFSGSMKCGTVSKGEDGTNFWPIITNTFAGGSNWGVEYGFTVPGMLTLGDPTMYINANYFTPGHSSLAIEGGVAFDARPVKMQFKAKYYKPADSSVEADAANIKIYFWKGSVTTADEIASTSYTDEMSSVLAGAEGVTLIGLGELTISQDIDEFTEQEIAIEYYTADLPEKMNIVFSASDFMKREDPRFDVARQAELCVDDVALVYGPSAVEGLDVPALEVAVTREGLTLNTTEALPVVIYRANGMQVAAGVAENGHFAFGFNPGEVYIVKVKDSVVKVRAI